jgi:hypothetical protein|tara:strand:+ start:64 stop:492 length:429 start_codon:yes stop_codon:yes gene_type:complete
MHNSKKNDISYKVIKLTNGETIIASLVADNGKAIEIQNPLLMTIVTQRTGYERGDNDSLNLSRWIEPYTEQKYFDIRKSTIITMANVSVGLSRYYEYFLQKLDAWEKDESAAESKSFEEEFTDEEIYDELLDELEITNKLIH